MRYEIKNSLITINASANTLSVPVNIGIENIRLIINETQNKLITCSTKKSNVTVTSGATSTVKVNASVCQLAAGDVLTFEIDDNMSPSDIVTAIIESKDELKEILDLFAYGYALTPNDDWQAMNQALIDAGKEPIYQEGDTLSLNLDQSAAINGDTLTLNYKEGE